MRILLATTSGAGHFGPLLPFGAAFRALGHDVRVAAPRSFSAAVVRAGYPYLPCDDVPADEIAAVYEGAESKSAAEQNLMAARVFTDLAPRAILPGMLAAFADWRPDLLVREFGELGSFIAAEVNAVPQIQVLVGLRRFHDLMKPVVSTHLSPLAEAHGVPVDRLWTLPTASLVPASFDEPGPDVIHRFRADTPSPVPSTQDTPLVYASFGTVSGSIPFARDAFTATVRTLSTLPIRVLVTIGDEGDPADWAWVPDNVRVEKWLPQHEALRGASAQVCHGGMGSVLGALTAGVPTVVLPQFADHPDNAERLAATGAGLRVDTPDTLLDAVCRVLDDPSFRTAAHRVATEIAALPPAGNALDLV
ncbi:glycosyltransferase [Umezawaea tangerina]|uniref:MGT family glycosyltransferase n=1 Tax=Umezawaea tangerina TaxID=84725 RepID=A0A2T0T4U1_9PSEU|nr:glycosyltransferase [Umezawaea tangerina]PRY40688.1 MGT family glycosyltransferase [Umezawaea tangerina]